MTATPSLAHCGQSGAGIERLLLSIRRPPSWFLRPRGGAGLKPAGPLPGVATGSSGQQQENSGSWTPSTLAHYCCPGWKTNSHLADCFHHRQASGPAEPFGKEVDRRLRWQTENQNYQPQVTTLLLQMKEEFMAERKHICNQVSQNHLGTTGLDFISHFPCEKQSRQQTGTLPATQGLFLCFHIFCVCE